MRGRIMFGLGQMEMEKKMDGGYLIYLDRVDGPV